VSAAAETAHELREWVRQLLAQERSSWAPLAAGLHAIHEHEAWRDLGADSFSDWMAQEDIGRSRGYLLVGVWDTFSEHELGGTELTKYVWILGPVRRGEVSAEDALADVRTLSRSDLRAKYALTAEDEEVELCPTCGQPIPRGTQ
jgi:hypothetical protein